MKTFYGVLLLLSYFALGFATTNLGLNMVRGLFTHPVDQNIVAFVFVVVWGALILCVSGEVFKLVADQDAPQLLMSAEEQATLGVVEENVLTFDEECQSMGAPIDVELLKAFGATDEEAAETIAMMSAPVAEPKPKRKRKTATASV